MNNKRLIDLIEPRTLNITLSDIAQGVRRPIEQLYFPRPKPEDETPEDAWKWAALFLIVVSGEGGRFGSYRSLPCWLEAVKELLSNCDNWRVLEELILLVESDLETYRYSEIQRERLRDYLDEQKYRVKDLKEQNAGLDSAWEWAKGWVPVLKSCLNEESLNIALQLYKSQKSQFEEYPEVLEWVLQIGREQRASLRSL